MIYSRITSFEMLSTSNPSLVTIDMPQTDLSEGGDNLTTIVELPIEIIDLILNRLPLQAILCMAKVSRAFKNLALFHFNHRLLDALSHERRTSLLHVTWSTPMNPSPDECDAWECTATASLKDHYNALPLNNPCKPELPNIDEGFLIFEPPSSDKCPLWGRSEIVEFEWFEDFVQFRFKLKFANKNRKCWSRYEFLNKIIRIPRSWAHHISETESLNKFPDQLHHIESLLFFDDETRVGIQLDVKRSLVVKTHNDLYEITLQRLWIPIILFLREAEAATDYFLQSTDTLRMDSI